MKYIAVDCFDTILHRKNSNESVLFSWAREISKFLNGKVTAKELYECRKAAEKKLQGKNNREDPCYEEVIKEIYLIIRKASDIEYTFFYSKCFETDILAERKELYVDYNNVDLLLEYKKSGCKIILITDFYMPKKFFEIIFSELSIGYLFDDLFVSSEIGVRKSTGNLYNYVLNYYSINADELMMIGDNLISDIKMAEKLGIKTKYIPYEKENNVYMTNCKLERELKKLFKVKRENDLFLGFIPAILLFVERLHKEALNRNCQKLLFCSREGQLLKKCFDLYQEKMLLDDVIETEYFYVSRRSTMLPSLKKIEDEQFERVFRQYRELTLEDFLSSIGFNALEIKMLVNIEERKTCIYRLEESKRLQEVVCSEKFRKIYENKRNEQKNFLIEYIKQINGNSDKLFIVDIGWKGTIQDNLFSVLEEKCEIIGFYFGLYGYCDSEKNRKIGLMFNQKNNIGMDYLYMYNHIELEHVFVANHGPVLAYGFREEEIVPLISEQEKEFYLFNIVKRYQDIMLKNFELALYVLINSSFDINSLEKQLARFYLRFLCKQEPKYKKIFIKFKEKSVENFGNISGTKEKKLQVNYDIHKKLRKKFFYVDYVYLILEKFHVGFLKPVAFFYCECVSCIKFLQFKLI